MLKVGSVVDGKYKILNQIGQGGMSTVFLAMNERANKQWAIKEVRKDGVQDFEVVRQGLVVEIDMLKKLNHDNLPSIIDVIDGDGSFLIVMDYIEGNTLAHAIQHYGAQPQEYVIEWAKQLCDVLGYLHSRKPPIIYRDMKPSNVMLKPDGNVKLIDFGTAREFKERNVADTTCLGTRGYAAPEQFGGQGQTDARTDIYCLGATLYHLLTGHNPSEPPYVMQPIRQVNPSLSSGLEKIIYKCIQPDPRMRYQTCAELYYDLEHYSELDIKHIKTQRMKLNTFIVTAGLTVLLGVGAIFGYGMESYTKSSNYDAYIEAAKTTDKTQKIQYYANAISLNPGKSEAYLELLNTYIDDDGIFSMEEERELRDIINRNPDNRRLKNIEYLKENKEGYTKFAFELAVAYWYYYEDEGNKNLAAQWFEEVSLSDVASEAEKSRAEIFSKIGKYYSSIGAPNRTGDASITYQDYWMDLKALFDLDMGTMDNEITTLQLYNEIAYRVFTNGLDLNRAGVSTQEMQSVLASMKSRVENMYIDANDDYRMEWKEKVISAIASAGRTLDTINSNSNLIAVQEGVDG